jgi:hypothetical protein
MQKVIIQGCSLIGLVIILGVVSVSAQMSTQYRAEIPFDFSVGNDNFAAGSYSIGPTSWNSSNGSLLLRNRKTSKSRLLGFIQIAGDGRGQNGKMYFINVSGRYNLSEIVTPTFVKKVKVVRTDTQLAKSAASPPKAVAVKLTN